MEIPNEWRFRNTYYRGNTIRKLMSKLGFTNFSKFVDTLLYIAEKTLERKDEIRRHLQKEISTYGFLPEDFVFDKYKAPKGEE